MCDPSLSRAYAWCAPGRPSLRYGAVLRLCAIRRRIPNDAGHDTAPERCFCVSLIHDAGRDGVLLQIGVTERR